MRPSLTESVLTFCHLIGRGFEPKGPVGREGSSKPATAFDSSISCRRVSTRRASLAFFFRLSVIDPEESAEGRFSRAGKDPEAVLE